MIAQFLTWFYIIACLIFAIRTNMVYKERMRVRKLVYNLAIEDLRAGYSYEWRFDEFAKVALLPMIYQLGHPVSAFYKDHPCLRKYRVAKN